VHHLVVAVAAEALPAEPVVFDKVNDRSLVGHTVIDEVPPGPRRELMIARMFQNVCGIMNCR
jgi:hypothetical protein